MFHCHQQDGRICAGWAGCHDMDENLAARLAVSAGLMGRWVYEALLDYQSVVPLFESGEAAAAHGLAGVERPDADAVTTIRRLTRKHERRGR